MMVYQKDSTACKAFALYKHSWPRLVFGISYLEFPIWSFPWVQSQRVNTEHCWMWPKTKTKPNQNKMTYSVCTNPHFWISVCFPIFWVRLIFWLMSWELVLQLEGKSPHFCLDSSSFNAWLHLKSRLSSISELCTRHRVATLQLFIQISQWSQ